MPTPEDVDQFVLEARAKSMSSAPSCSRTSRAGCRARSAAASSSLEVAGRLWRERALSVRRSCCPPASATAPLMASWSPVSVQLVGPDGHGEPERPGDQRSGRPASRGPGRRQVAGRPELRRQVGVGQPVPVRDGVPEGHGADRGGRAWGRSADRCAWPARHRRRPAPATSHGRADPRRRGSGAPRRPRFAAFPSDGPHVSLPGGSGGATLPVGVSREAAGPGSRCGRRSRRSSTARRPVPRVGARRARRGS